MLLNLTSANRKVQSIKALNFFINNFLSRKYISKYFLCITLILIVLCTNNSFTQYLPVITNSQGDTIHYIWPIPDSLLCIKDEIIIKFKANALNLNKLCYTYQGLPTVPDPDLNPYNAFKNEIMNQQFPIDTLIVDPSLKMAIKQFGGIYLTRITSANPCTDTISITRYGDTVKCENYLWMKLKLNNDTSMVNSCIWLTILYQYLLEGAEPNYCRYANRPDPIDPYYLGHWTDDNDDYFEQLSLKSFLTDARRAWDYQVGSYNIKVGIIDNGIDYNNCDFGGDFGIGKKVADGYNYLNNNMNIFLDSDHGTSVAGIIGSLTNGASSCIHPGIAGIAGGWVTENNLGCALYGFKVGNGDDIYPLDKIIGAMREAASDYDRGLNDRGSYRVHILNCSYGDHIYSEMERAAINFAFEQGVSIVGSRGNNGSLLENYPACYDREWITSVGGHDAGIPEDNINPKRWSGSSYGFDVDITAPATADIIVTTRTTLPYWGRFDMTSAAAPHVAGGITLLRSEFLDNQNHSIPPGLKPEPEDFENMIKAAALDMNYGYDEDVNEYTTEYYDKLTGWGQLKIGKIFEMLADGYVLKHYKITQLQHENEYENIKGGIAVHAEGLRRDVALMPYPIAERRTITGSITLEDNWVMDGTHNLYVWGRNGRTLKGGFNKSNLLYLTSYTEVTNGQGGNGIAEGIIHNNSLTVNAKTYQYRLNHGIELPLNTNLELYISVFGKPILTSVNDLSILNSNTIYPNPANECVILKLNIENSCSPMIKIIDNLGNVIFEMQYEYLNSGIHEKVINISNLSSGLYFVEIKQSNKIEYNKLIITK